MGGDGSFETDAPATDRIELSFDHYEWDVGADFHSGAIHVEEKRAFVENRRFGGIDVFGFFAWVVVGRELELSGGEGGDSALMIANRNHEPSAETVAHRFRV